MRQVQQSYSKKHVNTKMVVKEIYYLMMCKHHYDEYDHRCPVHGTVLT